MEKEPLHHPARIKIIRIMGDEGGVLYSDLKEKTGLSTGSIYYHLGVLEELTEREGNKYVLNEVGEDVYKSILKGRIFEEVVEYTERTPTEQMFRALFAAPLFERLSAGGIATVALGGILLVLEFFISISLGVNQFLFVLVAERTFHPAVSTLLSWLGVFLIFYFTTTSVYRRVGEFNENLSFLISILVSFLPIYLYGYLFKVGIAGPSAGALLQFVSAMWIASALTFVKGVRIEHSMLMALVTVFINDLPFITFP